jgi:hypothetical protein
MADGSAIVTAPAGWGWSPGAMLAGDPAGALPDLPLLSRVAAPQRNQTVEDAIKAVPGLAERLRPHHLQSRYGLPQSTASVILARVRGTPAPPTGDETIAARILRVLADGPSTTGEVAAELDLKSKLAATHLLQLMQRGKLEREPYSNQATPGRQTWLWSLARG